MLLPQQTFLCWGNDQGEKNIQAVRFPTARTVTGKKYPRGFVAGSQMEGKEALSFNLHQEHSYNNDGWTKIIALYSHLANYDSRA